MPATEIPAPTIGISDPVVTQAIRIHRRNGDDDSWHGDRRIDVHIHREADDQPARWYAYPRYTATNGNTAADTQRLLASGDVPPAGERPPLSAT